MRTTDCHARKTTEKVKNGRVLEKSKKLHTIKALLLPSDVGTCTITDKSLWAQPIKDQFSGKWGSTQNQLRLHLLDFIFETEACPPELTEAMLLDDSCMPSKRNGLDHYGVSVDAIRLLCLARPSIAVAFFKDLLGSTPLMSSIVIKGRVFGKEASTTMPSQTRAILPLPSVSQVCDCILTNLLNPFIDTA